MKTTSSMVDIDTNVNESVVNTQDVSIYDEEFWDSFATVVATTISDRNYLYNTSFGNVTSYIYGQEYTNYHMGASTLAHGGCGIIATYNALRFNGRIINLADTIRLFEENWTLTIYGWLGTNPYGIGDYFDRNHVDYTEYSTPSDYLAFKNYVNENIDTRQTYIVSFLLEPSTIFGGAHTVAFYSLGGKLYAFNRHNNDVDICEYDSLDDLIGEYPSEKFVVGYSLGFRSRLLEDETNLAFLDK